VVKRVGKGENFEVFAEYYDSFYLPRKDYEREANIIEKIIRKFETKETVTLLDVGCGTGEHLKHLASVFSCEGLDVNNRMIEIAEKKVPEVKFSVANMLDFKLKNRFDAIICLFGSIGYARTLSNLKKTMENFHNHLHNGGLIIVEPWVFKKDFRKGHISLDTFEDDELKFVRMARSSISTSTWMIFMHYLIGKNQEIEYFTEVHEMLALNHQDYTEAVQSSAFKDIRYLTENLWDGCRGLFVARK
jgi:ubiquinone/menaquinone biosynthesis C-methylase UbiE